MKERSRVPNRAAALPRSLVGETALPARRNGFPVPLSERKMLLFLLDVCAMGISLLAVLHWRLGYPILWKTVSHQLVWFTLLATLVVTIGPLLNAYDLRKASKWETGITTGVTFGGAVALTYLAIPYITPPLLVSRLTAGLFVLFAVVSTAALRLGYRVLLVQPVFRQQALIVGAGWAGRTIATAIRTNALTEYDLLGFIDDDPEKHDDLIANLPVLGTHHELVRFAREGGISEVIVAITHYDTMNGDLVQALMDCHEYGVRVTAMSVLYEKLTGKVPVAHAGRSLSAVLPLGREPSLIYLAAKRGIDIVISLGGLTLLVLLLPLVAVLMRLEGKGPVFYSQVRLGRGGRPYELLKFRTMLVNAEAQGPQWAQEGDERVTRIGRVLRSLHLDEIPQAINLLRGEMSFVGPRPERPEFVEHLAREIPFYRARHAVRPGVTGWAQVNFRYGASFEDALEKLQYDLYYIKYRSFWLDLMIMIKTVGLFLSLRGR